MPKPGRALRLPQPLRFLFRHVAVGFAAAALFVGGLVVTNPGEAGTVLLTAADHWWPALLLWCLIGTTFGAAQIGIAVMASAEAPPARPRGGSGAPAGFAPVLLKVRARRR
jgi:hypothetical protein